MRLPLQPVDRFTFKYFLVLDSSVVKCDATYYVNARYTDVFPDESGGAPLVDDWLILGFDRGRLEGWSAMSAYLVSRAGLFLTEAEAYASASEAARRRLDTLVQQAAQQQETINALARKLIALGSTEWIPTEAPAVEARRLAGECANRAGVLDSGSVQHVILELITQRNGYMERLGLIERLRFRSVK